MEENLLRKKKIKKIRNFESEYIRINEERWELIEAAKIYILANFKKIENYSDLSLNLKCVNYKGTTYFGKKEMAETYNVTPGMISDFLKEIDEKTIEILLFDEAIHDQSDGDFSVVFNCISYNWIDNESIIDIASYIEKNLIKADKK
jgi:hypothetical protein